MSSADAFNRRAIKKLSNKLEHMANKLDEVPENVMKGMAKEARKLMIKHTKRGKDENMNPFVKYAKSTKAHRRKLGRQTGHVDLYFMRNMLKSLGVLARPNYSEVNIIGGEANRIGSIHQHGGGTKGNKNYTPERKWWGWRKDMVDGVYDRLRSYVKKTLEGK